MGVTTFEISIEDFEGLMSDEKTYSFELYVIFFTTSDTDSFISIRKRKIFDFN